MTQMNVVPLVLPLVPLWSSLQAVRCAQVEALSARLPSTTSAPVGVSVSMASAEMGRAYATRPSTGRIAPKVRGGLGGRGLAITGSWR